MVLYRYGRTAISGTQAGGQHPAASRRAEQRQCRRQHHGRGCVQHQHQPQGLYDALTGLPTRNLFRQRVNDTIKDAGSYSGSSSSTWTTLRPSTTISGMRRAIRPSELRLDLKEFTERHFGLACRYGATNSSCSSRWTPSDARPSPGTPRTSTGASSERCGYAYGTSIGVSFYPLSRHSTKPSTWRTRLCTSSKRSGKGTFTCLPSHAEWL